MVAIRIPFFQIWYSSVFLTTAFIAWVATLVSPTDLIWTCIRIKNIPNGIAVGAIYVGTLIIGFFIWASRIYTNRAALKEIPRAYIPVDKGEVPRKVHKMIKRQWARSSIVAWDSRPRDLTKELVDSSQGEEGKRPSLHAVVNRHTLTRRQRLRQTLHLQHGARYLTLAGPALLIPHCRTWNTIASSWSCRT